MLMANKRRPSHAASAATPARKAAFQLVSAVRTQEVYLSSVAPMVLEGAPLSPSDKAFARLLAQGALSLQTTLDALIDRALRSPRDIKPDVRDALRLAAYEILYLHKEDHAAVDQGVELVRFFAPRATGVANYVLHRIVEEKSAFPFGDPEDSLEVAALFYGFPEWLARAIKKDIGTRNAISVMKESLEPAPVYFTANACVTSHDAIAQVLEEAAIEYATVRPFMVSDLAAPRRSDTVFQLANRADVGQEAFSKLLQEGAIVVSDLSAQSIVERAVRTLPSCNARVLEIGAGRGTKTILMQSACARVGIELAAYDVIDIKKKKLQELEQRMRAAGGMISQTFVADATKELPASEDGYDLVFVDAPCSGIGTLRRHPEIKARLAEDDPHTLAHIGQAMLERAAACVRPGGALMYATCTILKEENDKTVKRFLASPAASGFEVVPIGAKGSAYFKTPIEPHGADLHFAALFTRAGES